MGSVRRSTWRSAAKRTLDVSASLVALLCLLPLLAVTAVLIRCDTRGSVLFRQERLGIGGRPFPMWKFRTLVAGSGRARYDQLSSDDPRLTSVGRFLRPWGIDELPQLWNVLRGQMSLVGPRPAPVYHLQHYTSSQRRRLSVKPGFTGWALIHGRNAISWDERIELDIWYVEHWSLWLDLKILARSVSTLLGRKGIYGPDGVNDTFGLPDE
jgi:sugar transferase EpsL